MISICVMNVYCFMVKFVKNDFFGLLYINKIDWMNNRVVDWVFWCKVLMVYYGYFL